MGGGGSGASHPAFVWFDSLCLGAAGRTEDLPENPPPPVFSSPPRGPRRYRRPARRCQADRSLGPAGGGGEPAGRQRFIAMTAAAKSAPDGYTLVMATIGEAAVSPVLFKEVPYNIDRDFAPISLISDATIVLATHGEAPFQSVADVIAAAKAQPGRISVGSPGNGTVNQIVLEWMALNTGTKFQHIPYKGSAPAANAIAANEIPLGMLASSSVAPHLKTGRVRVLAVASARRSRFGPDWPTLQEAGVAEVNASTRTALLAPKDTPQPVIDKLNAEVVKVLEMPDIKERFAAGGVDTIPSSPAGLGARIKQETAQFGMIVQKADIKPD